MLVTIILQFTIQKLNRVGKKGSSIYGVELLFGQTAVTYSCKMIPTMNPLQCYVASALIPPTVLPSNFSLAKGTGSSCENTPSLTDDDTLKISILITVQQPFSDSVKLFLLSGPKYFSVQFNKLQRRRSQNQQFK